MRATTTGSVAGSFCRRHWPPIGTYVSVPCVCFPCLFIKQTLHTGVCTQPSQISSVLVIAEAKRRSWRRTAGSHRLLAGECAIGCRHSPGPCRPQDSFTHCVSGNWLERHTMALRGTVPTRSSTREPTAPGCTTNPAVNAAPRRSRTRSNGSASRAVTCSADFVSNAITRPAGVSAIRSTSSIAPVRPEVREPPVQSSGASNRADLRRC